MALITVFYMMVKCLDILSQILFEIRIPKVVWCLDIKKAVQK